MIEPTQLIFGGKTNRCHPNSGRTMAPAGQYYTHTISHWQTPASFLVYITKAIIPYRLKTIQDLGLEPDQMMVFIYDLHYSHKDPAVLEVLAANYIVPIFIPAGCTDLHQVCDVCINKPYKNGVAAVFIDTISSQYTEWYNGSDRLDTDIFKVNLSIGATKPLISSYVNGGVARLKTPEMKESIAQCVKKEGLLDIARLQETYERALLVLIDDAVAVPEDIEVEEDLGPVEDEDV